MAVKLTLISGNRKYAQVKQRKQIGAQKKPTLPGKNQHTARQKRGISVPSQFHSVGFWVSMSEPDV